MTSYARQVGELLLWATALVCGGVAVRRWRLVASVPIQASDVFPQAPLPAPKMRRDSLARLARFTAEHNPFRLNHQPAASGVIANQTSGGVVMAVTVRPALVLKGVVGGAPAWEAVIEGVPGRQGSVVVAKGDTLAGLRIRRVGRDTVFVEGADTTFRLTLPRPGP